VLFRAGSSAQAGGAIDVEVRRRADLYRPEGGTLPCAALCARVPSGLGWHPGLTMNQVGHTILAA
jgi:hypothetical protein